MAKVDIMSILRSRNFDPGEFVFDNLWMPPMYHYLSQQDIQYLGDIATSLKMASKLQEKRNLIDQLMVARGFRRFASGTNRVIYRYTEDNRFVAKIALDRTGMTDNPREFKNQFELRPFVAKTFQVSENGAVGFSERVLPITKKGEFALISDQVFDIIVYQIIGKYIMADFGSAYPLNWGIRENFGPVLLDYPYLYLLDGRKIFCTKPMLDGLPCNGEIDYDDGFNELVCTKCGKIYMPTDLSSDSPSNTFVIKRGGNIQMKIEVWKGDTLVNSYDPETTSIVKKPSAKPPVRTLKVSVIGGSTPRPIIEETSKVDNPIPKLVDKFKATDLNKTVVETSTKTAQEILTETIQETTVEPAPETAAESLTVISLMKASGIFRNSISKTNINPAVIDEIIDAFEDDFIINKNALGRNLTPEELMNLIVEFNARVVTSSLSKYQKDDELEETTETTSDETESDIAIDEETRISTAKDLFSEFMPEDAKTDDTFNSYMEVMGDIEHSSTTWTSTFFRQKCLDEIDKLKGNYERMSALEDFLSESIKESFNEIRVTKINPAIISSIRKEFRAWISENDADDAEEYIVKLTTAKAKAYSITHGNGASGSGNADGSGGGNGNVNTNRSHKKKSKFIPNA